MDRREVHRLRIAGVAHVGDHHATADAGADVGVAAIDHDLDAVASAALVGVPDERDVAGALWHNHDLPSLLFGRLIDRFQGG